MNKSMMTGAVVGVVAATAIAGFAGYQMSSEEPQPKFAEVLSAVAVSETFNEPREVCENVVVTRQKPVQDEHRVAGTIIGAVGGALAGDALGGGGKNTGAKVAGAVVGGYTGNKVQGNMQAGDTYQTTERRCETVTDQKERTVGYDVTYKIGEEIGQVRMDHNPGAVIPLNEGQLVLSRGAPATATQ